jgi:arylamine N-acetyltransferase
MTFTEPEPQPLSDEQLLDYLQRVGLPRDVSALRPATPLVLARLTEAHVRHIPFENLKLLLLRCPISLDINDVFAELVTRKRGGYCFQISTLMAAVLRKLGFEVSTGSSRVSLPSSEQGDEKFVSLGMAHMVLFVRCPAGNASPQDRYLVDVGFGGNGLVNPILLVDGAECDATGGERHRISLTPPRGISRQHVENKSGPVWYLYHHRADGYKPAPGSDADGWLCQVS